MPRLERCGAAGHGTACIEWSAMGAALSCGQHFMLSFFLFVCLFVYFLFISPEHFHPKKCAKQ